jgi:hypothetical protein
LHFNPDLPAGFCDAIAAMMDKNPDRRTPTAAAVIELLRPWRDEDATKHLAELSPSRQLCEPRGGKAVSSNMPALDETASFVFDDAEIAPNPAESPSQISQGTVPLASELEDTLSGVDPTHRAGRRSRSRHPGTTTSRSWRKAAIGTGIAAAAAAALTAARLVGLL